MASVHKPPTPRIGELPGHGAAPAVPPQPQGGRRVRAPGGHVRKALGADTTTSPLPAHHVMGMQHVLAHTRARRGALSSCAPISETPRISPAQQAWHRLTHKEHASESTTIVVTASPKSQREVATRTTRILNILPWTSWTGTP
eukprot:COSAG01_NODE_1556_length_9940_cov_13.610337_12_plen_143_part_00